MTSLNTVFSGQPCHSYYHSGDDSEENDVLLADKLKSTTRMVVRQSRWSPDPALMLEQATRNSEIGVLQLHDIVFSLSRRCGRYSSMEALERLLSSRMWRSVTFRNCCFETSDNEDDDILLDRVVIHLLRRVTQLVLCQTPQLVSEFLHGYETQRSVTTNIPESGTKTILESATIEFHSFSSRECPGLLSRLLSTDDGGSCLQELCFRYCSFPHQPLWNLGDHGKPGDKWRSLNRLVLSNCERASSMDMIVKAVVTLLGNDTSYQLQQLDLSSNGINDSHMRVLVPALTRHRSLEQVNLSFNEIGDDGLVAFCDSLASVTPDGSKLQKIALKPNPWSQRGAEALMQVMQQNLEITYLDSLWGVPSRETINMLRYYASINRAGRRLVMKGRTLADSGGEETTSTITLSPAAAIHLGLWPLVLERAGRLSYSATSVTPGHQDREEQIARANGVFYLLQNVATILFVQRQTRGRLQLTTDGLGAMDFL